MAVYPIISSEAKAEMMIRYVAFREQYNRSVVSANRQVANQNRMCREAWKKDESGNLRKQNQGFVLNNRIGLRHEKDGTITFFTTWDYNAKAQEYNAKCGKEIIQLKKIQPLRDSHEQMFTHIIWEYNSQLMKSNKSWRTLGTDYIRELMPVQINSKKFVKSRHKSGVYLTDVRTQTIRNRKLRLMEAGVLIGGVFHGSKRGTTHFINPLIMAFSDDFTGHITTLENQQVTNDMHKNFMHTGITTRTLSNIEEIGRVDNSTTPDADQASLENVARPSDEMTRSPSTAEPCAHAGAGDAKKPGAAGAAENNGAACITTGENGAPGPGKQPVTDPEKQARALANSKMLRERLAAPFLLAQMIAAGKYEFYRPIDHQLLQLESRLGVLSKEEFRMLLIQEFFKLAAQLYPSGKYDCHAWTFVMNRWYDQVMKVNTGHSYTKVKALETYLYFEEALLNRQFGAIQNVNTGQFTPAFPPRYLDPGNKADYSFRSFCDRFITRRKVSLQKRRARDQKQWEKNQRDLLHQKAKKALFRQLARHYNGKLTHEALQRYILNVMPRAIRSNIEHYIAEFTKNRENDRRKKHYQN
ncbi:hypothetical protein [Robiginitalea biformata]|uniref:Uncharacterized protein n=1 Tax=Robiginitalea biformata (strain ATCC BAA-864 / DSM 15991 / KCTC 12146 / HTCC2501) TaxID=313596 RepID=A4CKL8_ROBBH|nr:hypothetical protein [Robiginitalea biformata]EAR15417.1 hypothetical protein RB2501_13854 [Robiginitalea biformata HTCC2501]